MSPRRVVRSVLVAAEVGLFGAVACGDDEIIAIVDGPSAVQPGDLLSDARITTAGGALTSQWRAYVATSRQLAETDAAALTTELRNSDRATWQPAMPTTDFRVTHSLADSWFSSEAARTVADNAITFQTPSGGWSKAIAFSRARQPGESYSSTSSWSWIGTFDNGATTEELWLLGGVARTRSDAKYQQSFLRGLAYIFAAQMPNGCWPQVFPLEGSYHDAVTFNDAATPNILALLGSVSSGNLPFVPSNQRTQAATSFQRGVACIVAAQVRVADELTIWGQQHDPLDLAPVIGRAYEPAALTTMESAVLMDVLMSLPNPGANEMAAVHAAAHWLNTHAIYGWRWTNGVLEAALGAGPLWARFYDLGTDQPIFGDRDGSVHYDVAEISEERRLGYAWYATSPAATLQRYQTWALQH